MLLTVACVSGALSINGRSPSRPSTVDRGHGRQAQALTAYGDLPLAFETLGTAASSNGTFLARGRGYALTVSAFGTALALSDVDSHRSATLDVRFVGASSAAVARAEAELPGKVHYLLGSDRAKWRTNVPTFERVRYAGVYSGIDLVYYGTQGELEYDFVVSPGASPEAIAMSYTGAESLAIDERGDLIVRATGRELRQKRPVLYQDVNGARQTVEGRYVIDDETVRFSVDSYDASRPLVIDPVLVYSGGVGGLFANDVAVDAAGNAYVAGQTHNPLTGQGEMGPNGGRDGFVRKINPAGTAVQWTVFIGGSADDNAAGIAIDAAGSAYVTGWTRSVNFPTQNAYDASYGGPPNTTSTGDAFIAKLAADGSGFVYSSYLGGAGDDTATDIAVRNGNAYLVGYTFLDFPTTAGAFQSTRPGLGSRPFVTQFHASGTALVYSTFLGAVTAAGAGYHDYGRGIALDAQGNAYVTGNTANNNFPTLNPAQTWSTPTTFTADGRDWAFVSKLNASGSALIYSTYLGGGLSAGGPNDGYHWTRARAIAVDAGGSAYVTGVTAVVNFPVTAGAFDTVCTTVVSGSLTTCGEAFVTKLSPSGSSFVYSTYLGGTTTASDVEEGTAIAVDSAGRAHVVGTTFASDFPQVNAIQPSGPNKSRPFYTVFSPSGSALEFSTHLSGTNAGDSGLGVALDGNGNGYMVGSAVSSDFPIVGGLMPITGGHVSLASGYLAKLSAAGCAYAITPSGSVSAPGTGLAGSVNLTASGTCGWAAWASVPWITVSPASGAGAATVTYTVATNPSTSPRVGTFSVAGTTVTVQQAGATCTATLSTTSLTPPAAGAAGSIGVTIPPGCAWTTSTNGTSWVTLSSGSTGSGAVNYSVAPNTSGSARSATLTIAGVAVSVQQAAGQTGCSYTLSTTNLSLPSGGGSGAITVATTTGCAWSVSSAVPWATVSGGGAGSGTVSYSVSANAGAVRSGSLLIAGQSVNLSQAAASGGSGVPGAPGALQATVNGTTVTLMWNAPSTGGAPTGYSLVGRLTAGGQVLATLPMGGATSFSLTAPNGTFVLSVAATNASGVGPESSPVTVTVPQAPAAPGAPSNLASVVSGSTVSFTWSPPSSGGAVANYVLLAGTTPGFSAPLASIPLGTAPSFAVPGVPPGTYYVRVLAQNAGGTSAASNEVAFTVAGLTAPGAPTLQTPAVNGSTVTLSWSAGAGGPPAGYTLIARATPGGAPIASVPLGGTSVSFSGVPSGTYYLALTASNAAGVSAPSVEVALVVP